MNVAKIEFDQAKAAEMYNLYRSHRGAHTKADAEIERIYYQISRGRKVIRAFESIRTAGLDSERRPVLAMVRADVKRCRFSAGHNTAIFCDNADRWRKATTLEVPWPGLPQRLGDAAALVPMIPVHLRPRAEHLRNYYILWEADWTAVPVDPMLLRRIGPDSWLVVAAWDLTPVEQAVLAGRL